VYLIGFISKILTQEDFHLQGKIADETDGDGSGKEHDTETGLYYYGARYYDPAIGRFISVDPAGGKPDAPQTWNRYVYTLNNPYKYVDPDGRDVWLVFRSLKAPLGQVGVHSFIEYVPDNPNDLGGNKRWVTGGYKKNGKLILEINNKDDLNWKGELKGRVLIPTPEGKTDTQHIVDTMRAYYRYESGSRDWAFRPEIEDNEGNCNNIATGALVGGGAPIESIRGLDPSGINWGLGEPLPEMLKPVSSRFPEMTK